VTLSTTDTDFEPGAAVPDIGGVAVTDVDPGAGVSNVGLAVSTVTGTGVPVFVPPFGSVTTGVNV